MKDILQININEMSNLSFDCKCGKHHTLNIHDICIKENAIEELDRIISPFKDNKIFVFSDTNTFKAAGKETLNELDKKNYNYKNFVIETGEEILIPDEKVVGRLFMEMDNDTKLIIAIGSGSINDIGKFLSVKTGIPYIIICTAPSMDGYASDGAPLICNGMKISFNATLAYAIIGDINIMKNAPMKLIRAGYGDIIGKITALMDWELAKEINDEYYCETCIKLTKEAVKKTIDSANKLKDRDENAIKYLIEALTLTGVAMGLVGVSRPASGAEHMLSHYWEVDFIKNNRFPELHGIKVGIATPIVSKMFYLLRDIIPNNIMENVYTPEDIENILKIMDNPIFPKDIGIDKNLFYESMLNCHKIRERYSVFKFALDRGKLEECAKIITDEIY